LREQFSAVNCPSKRLKVADQTQPLHKDLEKALVGLHQHIKRYDLFLDFLDKGPSVNQLSVVCLFKHCLKISPKAGKDGLNCLMAVLSWVARHNIHTTFEVEWSHMKPHLDDALCRSWLSFKSSGLAASVWWNGVRKSARLLLPEAETEELVNLPVDGDWSVVERSLSFVVQDSITGKALFGSAFAKLLRGKATTAINKKVQELLAGPITQAALDANRAQFLAEMLVMGRDAMEAQPVRDIEVRYRGALIVAKVSTAYDEYSLIVNATVRGAAVECGILAPLFCENDLVPPSAAGAPKLQVEKSVVDTNAAARHAAEELMRSKVHSGLVIVSTLEEHRLLLLQLDRSFRLEIAFFASVSGDGAERRVRDEVLKVLPKAAALRTTTQVLDSLVVLGKAKLLEFCGVGLQATFRSVVGIVEAIAAGKPPAFDGTNLSPFMAAILEQMALFCNLEDDPGPEGAPEVLLGKVAATKMYTQLLAKHAAKQKISLLDLKSLVPFTWLVDAKVTDDIKKWSAEAAKADMFAGAAAAVAAGAKGAGKGGRRKSAPDARALVLACLKD
jgi:hypothetical protein